jgi:hypothetical protein
MELIKGTVVNVLESLKAKKQALCGDDPRALLKKILTKKESQHIKFNYFKKGVLGLYVEGSSWLYSLNLRKEDLVTKLHKKSSAIKDIRFRIGEIR